MTLIAQNACDLPMKDERRARSASVTGEESLAKLRMSHRDIRLKSDSRGKVSYGEGKGKRKEKAGGFPEARRIASLDLGTRCARRSRRPILSRIENPLERIERMRERKSRRAFQPFPRKSLRTCRSPDPRGYVREAGGRQRRNHLFRARGIHADGRVTVRGVARCTRCGGIGECRNARLEIPSILFIITMARDN